MSYSSRQNVFDRFLQDVANLKELTPGTTTKINYPSAASLLRRYRNMWPPAFTSDSALARIGDEVHARIQREAITGDRTAADRVQDSLDHVFQLARELRKVWAELDDYKKGQLITTLRHQYRAAIAPDGLPQETEFDRAMDYFQRIGDLAKHCHNHACLNRYFIAAKRSYKHCSPKCAAASQRVFKNAWWAQHGPGWRARRRAKEAKGKRGER